eukprot:7882002-Pyramimonas_sp.AAC.1
MGLGALLEQLPGWGVLFFAREHRVYMVHKSLSDWLWAKQLRSSPADMLKLDVSSGHLRLAVHLAKARASPSQYTLKYLGLHLSLSVEHSSCKELLDSILQDWDFLVQVMKAKCGIHWNRALGGILTDQHTPTSYDTMRWLKLAVHRLEKAPSMRTFNSSACVFCPLGSTLHEKAAASEQNGGFKCVQVGEKGGYQELLTLRNLGTCASPSVPGMLPCRNNICGVTNVKATTTRGVICANKREERQHG